MAIWITVYHWAAFMSKSYFNYSLAGTIGYFYIFMASTPLTESISASKYPQYKEYQQLVGRFMPGFLGGIFKRKSD
jgi:steroid 5-alpha reductase family enzyme